MIDYKKEREERYNTIITQKSVLMATNNNYTPSKAHVWNRLTCDAIHYVNMSPTVAARALAMVHTAMYDAWTNYNDGGCEVTPKIQKTGRGRINRRSSYAQSYTCRAVRGRMY